MYIINNLLYKKIIKKIKKIKKILIKYKKINHIY